MRRRFAMHVHISTLFVLILVAAAIVAGVSRQRSVQQVLDSTSAELMRQIEREATAQLDNTLKTALLAVSMLSRTSLVEADTYERRRERLGLMREALEGAPSIVSVFAGYGSGDHFQLRRVRDEADLRAFKAPEGTRYILQSAERQTRPARGRFVYLDAQLRILREDSRPDYVASYDPRTRVWYRQARERGEPYTTAPYLFFTSGRVGITTAVPVQSSSTVVAADIYLDTLGSLLKSQKPTAGSQMALVSADGTMYAHEDLERVVAKAPDAAAASRLRTLDEAGVAVFSVALRQLKALEPGKSFSGSVDVEEQEWRLGITPIRVQGMQPLALVVAVPDEELLVSARQQFRALLWFSLALVALTIPITIWAARRVSTPIQRLALEAQAIQRFDFAQPVQVRSSILEVDDLAKTMEGMKQTIRRFLTLSQAVAAEEDFQRLLPLLLSETMAAVQAKAGLLYLADGDVLQPAAALDADGQSHLEHALPTAAQDGADLVSRCIREQQPCVGGWSAEMAQALGLRAWAQAQCLPQAVAVPLLNRSRQLVGCLLLLRESPFDEAQVSFIKALSGSAASSLETRELIKSQRELFEAFIRLIAGAIDAKSPYTGGHCERVPELTKMLARAADRQTQGPFADFRLDEQDWEAVHVASWLHDCGKITTPEYVVDKATKLETLYDRIHEVRMRFEVLKRDAQIESLQARVAGADAVAEQQSLEQRLRALDDDFAFVASCNLGGEAMSDADLQRLGELARRKWWRTLDDRLGISAEELRRKQQAAAPAPLPVAEPLLADKPEHRMVRPARERLQEGNAWGFRMTVPDLLYDRGELYNLSVRRGTLTQEDRYKINEHIVQTIRMLSTLPFPKHLRQVPEIAGGHHEKMDGSGYPKRLRREQMSPVARMMAIADVFEALTAVDRPYKKGKTLSEALQIMVRMQQEQHIDPDLFELFLREGIYRDYAARFLQPEQIDVVDAEGLLRRLREGTGAAAG